MPQIPDDMEKFWKFHAKQEADKPRRMAEMKKWLFLRCGHSRRKYEENGYGLAGGGCGPYTYCKLCSMIDEKFEEMS